MPDDGDRLLALAGTAAGVLVALALTLVQPSTYRADASIALARQGQPPGSDPQLAAAAAAASELFHTRAVAESAIANLRLDESPDDLLGRVSVETEPKSLLVRVRVDGPSREEARRTAQELVEVSSIRFNDRFGPATVAQIWEKPRAEEDPISPKPARNLALGALLGALAGAAVGRLRQRRDPGPRPVKLEPPPLRPAPAFEIERISEPKPAPVPKPLPEPEPVSLPEPESVPQGPFVLPRLGEWRLADVEHLLAEHGDAFPDQIEELRWYVDSFRDVVGPDGLLPGGVEAVMEDVFRDVIEHARTANSS